MLRACIFCGRSDQPFSDEHLFADWLTAYYRRLGVKDYTERRILYSKPGVVRDESKRKRKISSTTPDVCEPCNNGRLSAIENDAKPLIISLMSNRNVLLTPTDRAVLAAWVTRLAMVKEFIEGWEPFYSAAERKNLLLTRAVPDDSDIWLARVPPIAAGATQHVRFGRGPTSLRRIAFLMVTTVFVQSVAFQMVTVRFKSKDDMARAAALIIELEGPWLQGTIRIHETNSPGVLWPPKRTLVKREVMPFADRFSGPSSRVKLGFDN